LWFTATRDETRIPLQAYTHEHRCQPPNLFAVRPDGPGPTRLTHFSGAPAAAIGAVETTDGMHTAMRKMGAGSREQLPPNANGRNERQLTHPGPRVNPACIDGRTSQRRRKLLHVPVGTMVAAR
jgi:hypothetical protein